MSKFDPTTYTDVLINTTDGTTLDATVLRKWYEDIKRVADLIDSTLTTHLDEKAGQIIRVKRDVSLSGDQIVSGFNRIPQLLLIDTVVSDTKKVSYGRVDADAQFGIYMRGDTGDVAFTGSPLSIDDTSVKRSRASVTINGDKTITLSWVHASGGGTGVADICITAFYHGEDSQ